MWRSTAATIAARSERISGSVRANNMPSVWVPPLNRLLERLAVGDVQAAEPLRQGVERRQGFGEIVDPNKPLVTLKPFPARIAEKSPCQGQIGPDQESAGAL